MHSKVWTSSRLAIQSRHILWDPAADQIESKLWTVSPLQGSSIPWADPLARGWKDHKYQALQGPLGLSALASKAA